jgi:hypothetical protein
MQKLAPWDTRKLLAKALHKPIVAIGGWELGYPNQFGWDSETETSMDDLIKAAPYLDPEEDVIAIIQGQVIIICDTMEEAWHIFNITNGDHPGKENPYRGPAKIYAEIIDENGEDVDENT